MKYFTLEELITSATAKAKNIDNTPTPEHKANLERLINELLDPLREAWGSAIKVTSGYRGFQLNNAVGGSKTSAHATGNAVDIVPANGKIKEFQKFIENWLKKNNINFDQYIKEKPVNGIMTWAHLALYNNTGSQRKQIFFLY